MDPVPEADEYFVRVGQHVGTLSENPIQGFASDWVFAGRVGDNPKGRGL